MGRARLGSHAFKEPILTGIVISVSKASLSFAHLNMSDDQADAAIVGER